jgi:hypothetical protein
MMLDAIIGHFVSLFGILAGGVAAVFVPWILRIAAGIDAVVGMVVSGFSRGSIGRRKQESRSVGAGVDSLADRLMKAKPEPAH